MKTKLSPLAPNDKFLRQLTQEITLSDLRTIKLQDDINSLIDFVKGASNKGDTRQKNKLSVVGLSANQVGLKYRIAVVDLGIGHKSYNDLYTLINPKIVWSSKTLIQRDEGCVNLNNIRGIVRRSKRVIVESLDRSGNKLTLDVHGWPAILLQHEIDHLDGGLFIDRLDDPTKAHLVKENQLLEYKKTKQRWPELIDVTNLVMK